METRADVLLIMIMGLQQSTHSQIGSCSDSVIISQKTKRKLLSFEAKEIK